MTTQITTQKPGETTADWQTRALDAQNYLALQSRFMEEGYMILWLCKIHRNSVQYPNADPATVQKIQTQLNKTSNLISIIYIWALLDEGGFKETTQWVSADERLELKAWKHVRHTGAHAPGGRANTCRDEFDQYMRGTSAALSGLRVNCKWDSNSIELKDGMNSSFFLFAQDMVRKAFERSANNNLP